MSNELAQEHLLREDAPDSARHPDDLARYRRNRRATLGPGR
jgi:hypothetical protein